MRLLTMAIAVVSTLAAIGCGREQLTPAVLEVGREACAYCRMTVSDSHLASQVLAPGELPKFFDDFGCLNHFLTATTEVPAGAAIFVTDHRTNEWVPAETAVFARVPLLATPMSSHLVAHASLESRAADPAATGGSPVAVAEVLPSAWDTRRGHR